MITNQAVVNYIMDAVSKTTPAKPENIYKHVIVVGTCPVCKAVVTPEKVYCDKCGQCLDWGNTEDITDGT